MWSLSPLLLLSLFLPFDYANGDPNITCNSNLQLLEGLVNSTGWQPPIDLFVSTMTPMTDIPDADFAIEIFDSIIALTGSPYETEQQHEGELWFGKKLYEIHTKALRFAIMTFDEAESKFMFAMMNGEPGPNDSTLDRKTYAVLEWFLRQLKMAKAERTAPDPYTCPACKNLNPHVRLEKIQAAVTASAGLFRRRIVKHRHSRIELDEFRVAVQAVTILNAFAAHVCNKLENDHVPREAARVTLKERFGSIFTKLFEWETIRASEANTQEVLEPKIREYLKDNGMAVLNWTNSWGNPAEELGELAVGVQKNVSAIVGKTIAVSFLDYGTTVLAFTGLAFDDVFSFPLENDRETRVYVFVTNRFEYKLHDALDSGAMQTWTDELVCPEGSCRSHVSYSEFFDFFWPKLQPKSEINYFGLTWSSSYMREARVQPPSSTAQFGLTFGWRTWGRHNWIFSRSGVQVVFGMKSVRRRT